SRSSSLLHHLGAILLTLFCRSKKATDREDEQLVVVRREDEEVDGDARGRGSGGEAAVRSLQRPAPGRSTRAGRLCGTTCAPQHQAPWLRLVSLVTAPSIFVQFLSARDFCSLIFSSKYRFFSS
uniref:Uncharacterized protein n=1 Tax=Triticum urartu TaxID=4572 RepID=A0A8R7TZS9_TRIUA